MKLLALALDYDGTIAHHDVLDPGVLSALAEIRSKGVLVIVVTGRTVDALRTVAGNLHFADCVIAENGAVIEFPHTGYRSNLGPPVPQRLIMELRKQGIVFDTGESIVDTHRNNAPRVLEIIQRLELPLVLVFNRSRLMILPQAISKGTGLRRALTMLRVSEHNTIGIGDAENDHELLRVCELAVAVAWGSETLRAFADYVLSGSGPPAVADYIRELGKSVQIPTPLKVRRSLLLGYTDDGHPLELAVRGRNALIAGDSKSGKSWVTGLQCEQMILYGYSLCILDPEGDYISLEALPGVVVLGGADPLPRIHDLLRVLRHADVSVVIDFSHATQFEKVGYMRTVLPALATLRRRTGLPHRIVVDEAHYFLSDPDVLSLLDLELNGYTLVTYLATKLNSALLAETEAVIVTRQSDPNEIEALRSLCSRYSKIDQADWHQMLQTLVIGQAVALPLTQETEGEIKRVNLTPRLTTHVRHLTKYIDVPVSASRAFVFWRNGVLSDLRARTLREFVEILEQESAASLDGHLGRHDFSNWISAVFGDHKLAGVVRTIEEDHRHGRSNDAVGSLARAVRSRYEFLDPIPGSEGRSCQESFRTSRGSL
jgi:hydroxymethylpyrimidine pyrophosphatase-like HAD family hydrolase